MLLMPDCNPELVLPPWIKEFTAGNCSTLLSDKDRMGLVIESARQNSLHNTGGPFGAAVFERYSGRLVSVGVNLVVRSNCSNYHAEKMEAIGIAERVLLYNGHTRQ